LDVDLDGDVDGDGDGDGRHRIPTQTPPLLPAGLISQPLHSHPSGHTSCSPLPSPKRGSRRTMRAVVFHSAGNVRVETVPDPHVEHPRDAIIRVTATSIAGSDLHAYQGSAKTVRPHVPGHELVGLIEEVGPEVKSLRKGDRVVIPFSGSC